MSLLGGFLRLLVFCIIIGALFFTGMLVFAFVAGLLVVLGVMEWLRRGRPSAVTEETFYDGRMEMPRGGEPKETVVEARVFEAEFTEMPSRDPRNP